MSLISNVECMAVYNQWMNDKVYTVAETLSAAELAADRGAFFGSIIGTLNHILVGDSIWLTRFAAHPAQLDALKNVSLLPTPTALNSILYPNFSDLIMARRKIDAIIVAFAHELSEPVLASALVYTNSQGKVFTKNFGLLIQHFFNHQTHHRGQVSTLLSQAGLDVGATDLLLKIPDL